MLWPLCFCGKNHQCPLNRTLGETEEIWALSKIISFPSSLELVPPIPRQNFPAIFRVIFGSFRFLSRV